MVTAYEDEASQDDARALLNTLSALMDLHEGELYTLRRGLLQHIPARDEDSALRRVRIMEEAYELAYSLARGLRKTLRGYRPDPALVISALVMHAAQQEDAAAVVQAYLQTLFTGDPAAPACPADGGEADHTG